CISRLSPQCRVCMVLFYIEGLKTNEISEIVGIAETAVRAHLSRGRKRMKELIENDKL
ncbi:MAG: sigma-70 family RNA polymerase sigma factor, partial [Bacteroidaceae bacterium]|nr:sigma-70 family RNA polymerase sigma factor [Bacteroidaceae bacterium]